MLFKRGDHSRWVEYPKDQSINLQGPHRGLSTSQSLIKQKFAHLSPLHHCVSQCASTWLLPTVTDLLIPPYFILLLDLNRFVQPLCHTVPHFAAACQGHRPAALLGLRVAAHVTVLRSLHSIQLPLFPGARAQPGHRPHNQLSSHLAAASCLRLLILHAQVLRGTHIRF